MNHITLIGGPWNGKRMRDLGAANIRMGIASEWAGNSPKIGAETGTAFYEPNESRTHAFWLENTWDGKIEDIFPA